MQELKRLRTNAGISQRDLARLAHVSFRSVQLIESGKHDPKLSTLQVIAKTLGYPKDIIHKQLQSIWAEAPHSLRLMSEEIRKHGSDSWKIYLFNFVDSFRAAKNKSAYLSLPPSPKLPLTIQALLASSVETLCHEAGMVSPPWCEGIASLKEPWFVAEIENLKAMSLVESPIHFRKRNIFVLENFLQRA